MDETPRPLNLGEILDRTVNLYRSRFLVFFGISVLPTVVILVIALLVFLILAWWGNSGAGSVSKAVAGILAVLFVSGIVLLAIPVVLAATALAEAAINHAVNCAYFGEKISIRDSYKAIWKRDWHYVWLYFLQGLIIWGVPIGAWVALIFLSAALSAWAQSAGISGLGGLIGLLLFVAFLALVAYFVWMLLRLSLAFPACVVERITAWAAIKRSDALSKGTRGRIFLLYLLGAALGWIVSVCLVIVVIIVAALVPGATSPQHSQTLGAVVLLVTYGGGFALQSLIKPVYGIALLIFYYDQRIRQEGFDIEWMMQRAGLVASASQDRGVAAPAESAGAVPMQEQEPEPAGAPAVPATGVTGEASSNLATVPVPSDGTENAEAPVAARKETQ